jgi:hypothetical protein
MILYRISVRFMLLAGALSLFSCYPFQRNTTMAPQVLDLGIPVRSVNWVQLHPGQDKNGQPCLYAVMGQESDGLFVLQINPETGAFRQFGTDVPEANSPTATLMSRSGKLYVGAAYAGHLLCFDPQKDRLEDLGAIHPEAAIFPCRMDEDQEGRIWIGSYGSADLTSYDPSTRAFTRHGRMDETDMYNYPQVNTDGTIACLIQVTRPHIEVFDPRTGEKHQVGPVATQGEHTFAMQRRADGRLYIESSLGNFLLDGLEAVPVEKLPAPQPAPALPDGRTFRFKDANEQRNRALSIRRPDGQEQVYELDYDAGGSRIFYVHAGPDECIYGSSIMPLHLFRHNPKDGELIDLGKCSSATGEAYSMANHDGKIYIASYPGAVLSVYDPSQGYHFGDQPGSNPRDLGRMDEISLRPRSTLAGPLGRIWTASIPGYGLWGGPLSWYEPESGERKAYQRVCGDASCYTLAWLQEQQLLAVGTTIEGGTGTQPKVARAELFLWDYDKEEKVWEGRPERPFEVINALLTGADGRLYGTAKGAQKPVLFVFDPQRRAFTHYLDLPPGDPLDLGLQNGPDGQIYGFTRSCLYRLDPATLHFTEIIRQEDGFGVAGPIAGAYVYWSKIHHLLAAKIF